MNRRISVLACSMTIVILSGASDGQMSQVVLSQVGTRPHTPTDSGGCTAPIDCNISESQKLNLETAPEGVAIRSDRAIVGVPENDSACQEKGDCNAGAAHVLRMIDGTWKNVATLTAADAEAEAKFGVAVALTANWAVIGAWKDDEAGEDAGAVYVFHLDDPISDQWSQVSKLTAPDAAPEDWFGRAVAMHEDALIVGAYGNDDGGKNSGAAYLYHFDGASWVYDTKLTALDAAELDFFGISVAIDEGVWIVGASGHDVTGVVHGVAYIFQFDGLGWVEGAELFASDGPTAVSFGATVAVNGETVIVGAPGLSGGAAYVFEQDHGGPLKWGEVAKLIASDGQLGDRFGSEVSFDGNLAILSAPDDDDACPGNSLCNSGSVYVFQRTPGESDNWNQIAKLTASDAGMPDRLGDSVAIDAGIAFCGGNAEAVYAYNLMEDDCDCNEIANACEIVGGAADTNGNGVPDRCEFLDCNENGVHDLDDVAAPTSPDCNGNAIPDECEISAKSPALGGPFFCTAACDPDCNDNGVPDECDPDCNANGLADQCDIDSGSSAPGGPFFCISDCSLDCNENGTPDECEPDCNNNDIADACDIADATSADCSNNGIPDECEADCNGNGAADTCDVVNGTSDDCNGDGIPDECGVMIDCDISGLVKMFDVGSQFTHFAQSLSFSGDTAIVGAPWEDEAGVVSGAAHIFQRSDGNWIEVARLPPPNPDPAVFFGISVSIFGDTAVVGAPDDPTFDWEVGAAYVYHRNEGGPDQWGLVASLTPADIASLNGFGTSVSIYENTVAVGAQINIDLITGTGYVFERDAGGLNVWGEVARLTPSGSPGSLYDSSISLSRNTVVIGIPLDAPLGERSGSAYVFQRDRGGPNNWGEATKLVPSDGAADDNFGISVSVSGDTVAIGTERLPGSAYVFEPDPVDANLWVETAIVREGVVDADGFGTSVSVDQDLMVVGAHSNDRVGAAYVFDRDHGGPDNWGQVAKLRARDGSLGDGLGAPVALRGNVVLAGAFSDTDSSLYRGSVYVFELFQDDCNCNGSADVCEIKDGLPDGDADGIPDECDITDCNGNDVADAKDITNLTSSDCNQNNIPDECDPDCNDNGVADACDIADGSSDDCTGNGIPDECEPDCNNNGTADSCDTASGNSEDCNGDGIPDECGTLIDCVVSEDQKLVASDAGAGDFFGRVAMEGNVAIIGASAQDCEDGSELCGAAYAFRFDGEQWNEEQRIIASDIAPGDRFGTPMAISGDLALIDGSKAVYVFQHDLDGNGKWTEVDKLFPEDPSDCCFGSSGALDGTTAVIGASYDQEAGFNAGAAHIFQRDEGGPNNWDQVVKLIASDANFMDQFGYSVALDEDTAIIGAYVDNDLGTDSGSAYIFQRNWGGADNWGEVVKLTAVDGVADDRFGTAVDIDGDTAVVGATCWGNSTGMLGTNCPGGAVYVFERHRGGPNRWGQAAKIELAGAAPSDEFGSSVSIRNGIIIAGTADVFACPDGLSCARGSVYVFEFDGADWVEKAKLTASDAEAGDHFGGSVSLSGNTVFIGASSNDDAGDDSGSAYVFSIRDNDCDCNGAADVCVASVGFGVSGFIGLLDHTEFAECMLGPDMAVSECCAFFDYDSDGDVDLKDASAFYDRFGNCDPSAETICTKH